MRLENQMTHEAKDIMAIRLVQVRVRWARRRLAIFIN